MEFSSRQLRAFHLVAQHGNFTRAAEALFITPSGLSVLIRELERQLCFRLFDRTTRQVTLTAQGRELLAVTLPSLRTLDTAMSRIEQATKARNQRISVGTTPWVAAHVLSHAIKQFRELHPELSICLFDGDVNAIVRRVETGKLDLGLGILPKAPGLRRTPVFRFSLVLIRSNRGMTPNRGPIRWRELNGQALISLTTNYPYQQLINKQLARAGISCRQNQIVNLLETQIALVEANEGVAVIPSFGSLACRDRAVTMVELVDPVIDLEFHQVSSRATKLPEEAKEFGAFVKMYIAGWAGSAGIL